MYSNFGFLSAEWPEVYADCERAESYLTSDPRAACFYSRRSIEVLVKHLYDVLDLPQPYKSDLAARINSPAFQTQAGNAIIAKLNLVRNLGNTAAHDTHPIPYPAALQVLRDLRHVMIWAAFRYSTRPDEVPTGSQFDPKLAAQRAPLSRDEIVKLAEKFAEQDEAHARELAERDDLVAEHEAEIAHLRAAIAAAQAAKTTVDDHDYREDETRDAYIDVLLREAGWPLDQPRDREYKVTGMPTNTGVGRVDYVLWGADGLPLAVVEAKRTRRSPYDGQEQARLYADALEKHFGRRPVIFYTNGYEHSLWDDAAGYPPREVRGFYTRDELEWLIQQRVKRLPLGGQPVDARIAGRHYQIRAVKAVDDAFDRKQRQALLVMATGTGKTRTVIALVKQLMNAGWIKNVLFLADRKALVRQARNAFTEHYPEVAVVNLVETRHGEGRVFVSTYPTMMGLIQETEDGKRRFGPGYFDLIIIDEAHRSVYAKYGYLFDYFDAMLVGLTATPKDEVDHNTYRLFHLEDGVPTDAYGLDAAIADQYLVPPRGVSVGTTFLRAGIRYEDLSDEEKDEWELLDWGDDGAPDAVGSEEMNRFLFNEDTVDKVLALLMEKGHKVAGGDRIGKTIIFAKNQKHAEFIAERFNVSWPEYAGELARVITHNTSHAESLIENFGETESAPHIAISVDMLDTGIDVPDVVNLLFFKLVRSKTKFWQMIGRGTRLRPNLFGDGNDKADFYVFDFCGNLEFFSQDLPGSEGSNQKSLTQNLFENRLELVRALDSGHSEPDLRRETAAVLHEFVSGMTLDNVLVRPHRRLVEKYGDTSAWGSLSAEDALEARALGGLPTSAQDPNEAAKRFDLLILRRQLAQLTEDVTVAERMRERVQAIAEDLLGKTTIPVVAAQAELLEQVVGDEWWVDVTLPMLELVRKRLRGLAQLVTRTGGRNPVYSDFEDTLAEAVDVHLPGTTPGLNWERFCAKATEHLRRHEQHVSMQKLRRNRQLTNTDLSSLEEMLVAAGAQATHLDRATSESGGLGLFVRSLVGLDRAAVLEEFAVFLDDSRYSVEQIRMIEMIVDELTAGGVMEPGRLFESPYTDYAPQGPEMVFARPDLDIIVDILNDARERAVASSGAA